MRKFLFGLALCLPVYGQTVTISQQPGQVFVATFGASIAKVAVYSAEVCPGASPYQGSWGLVRQIAEGGGINVVDNVLVAPTAQKAESKTKVHKAVIAIGAVGLSAAVIGVFHGAPVWLIGAGASLSGLAAVVDPVLTASEAQVQNTITAAMGSLADPTAQFLLTPGGACTASKIFLGQYVANFKPLKVAVNPTITLQQTYTHNAEMMLPSSPSSPSDLNMNWIKYDELIGEAVWH
jgi:hypothetical protein